MLKWFVLQANNKVINKKLIIYSLKNRIKITRSFFTNRTNNDLITKKA